MKIIGKTGHGFLVEMSSSEIAYCGGYIADNRVPGWRSTSSYAGEGTFPVGLEIEVTKIFQYLEKLRDHEDKVRSSAAFLRGMADMIDLGLPTTVVPPEGSST